MCIEFIGGPVDAVIVFTAGVFGVFAGWTVRWLVHELRLRGWK